MSILNVPKRELVHIFGGLSIAIAALLLPRMVFLISIGAVTFIFLTTELIRFRVPLLNRWFLLFFQLLLKEKEASRFTGASYMFVASFIAYLAFQRGVAVLAISFLAVGDSLAGIVGKRLGKRRFLGKTLEGDVTSFVSCVAVGLAFYYGGLDVPLATILVGSLGAAVAEAMPLPVNDNLAMPLFAGVVMTIMLL